MKVHQFAQRMGKRRSYDLPKDQWIDKGGWMHETVKEAKADVKKSGSSAGRSVGYRLALALVLTLCVLTINCGLRYNPHARSKFPCLANNPTDFDLPGADHFRVAFPHGRSERVSSCINPADQGKSRFGNTEMGGTLTALTLALEQDSQAPRGPKVRRQRSLQNGRNDATG